MTRERKHVSGPDKLPILKRYLVEKIPLSDLCDQHGLQPSQIYYWQNQLFEHSAALFDRKPGRQARQAETAKDRQIAQLGMAPGPLHICGGDLRAAAGNRPGVLSQQSCYSTPAWSQIGP